MKMKKIVVILFLFCFSKMLYGDPSPEAQRFLLVHNAIKLDITTLKKLPEDKGIRKFIKEYYSVLDGIPVYKYYCGYKLDLNKDGVSEYFIHIPLYSGTGGRYYIILSFVDKKWKIIGGFQGIFLFLKVKNGWHSIIFTGRGGDEYYAKVLYEFKNGKYNQKWIKHFDHGKITHIKTPQMSATTKRNTSPPQK